MSDTSTASKKSASVRTCSECRVRMSSIDIDPHILCISCRGKKCGVDDRCPVCEGWSDERMTAYTKHQASLERKRLSKKRVKESKEYDFALACTGGEGRELPLSEDGCSGMGVTTTLFRQLQGVPAGRK